MDEESTTGGLTAELTVELTAGSVWIKLVELVWIELVLTGLVWIELLWIGLFVKLLAVDLTAVDLTVVELIAGLVEQTAGESVELFTELGIAVEESFRIETVKNWKWTF